MNIEEKLLEISPMTRSGEKRDGVKHILIHEMCHCLQNAKEAWTYLHTLAYQENRYESYHYIIGQEGECMLCIPEQEISWSTLVYGVDSSSISIACLPMNDKGEWSDQTFHTLQYLLKVLCMRYGLKEEQDVKRHYDITGTRCPVILVDQNWKYDNMIKKIQEQ